MLMSGDFTALTKDDWFNLFCKTCSALDSTDQIDKAAELAIQAMKVNTRRKKNPARQALLTHEPDKKEVGVVENLNLKKKFKNILN